MISSKVIKGSIWLVFLIASVAGACSTPSGCGVLNGLDLKLLKVLTTDLSKNEAVSPFVMSSLLSQVWLGANGLTRTEMTPVLGVRPGAPSSFLPSYQSAIDYLSTSSITSVFNRIYLKDDTTVKQSFAQLLNQYYRADVSKFSTAAEAASDINTAVANVTNNLIKNLVSKEALKDIKLVLVSALYFKDLWKEKFPDTRSETFLTSIGQKMVQMMKLRGKEIPYVNIPGKFDAISLQYQNEDYSMILLRPLQKSMVAVQTLLNSLDSTDLAQVFAQMQPKGYDVSMPRFKIKAKYDDLISVLSSMGIKRLFTDQADLSNMSQKPLRVNKVILEVVIDVNEEGTEAAGAGGVGAGVTSVPPQFTLDRPFVAVVWNAKHNMSLFEAFVGSP